ncbi:hypothetical protein ES288_A10G260700v1 [Gossypium darwinii]|uniref:Uncharacterized protein n=1 Tax=Gossypium darwinii TaxID=34276 RepID=A0A5D2F2E9_GOSDA|nr:hypothetical protein ES288_A10G260700v1 [Gossypium darwinii]
MLAVKKQPTSCAAHDRDCLSSNCRRKLCVRRSLQETKPKNSKKNLKFLPETADNNVLG